MRKLTEQDIAALIGTVNAGYTIKRARVKGVGTFHRKPGNRAPGLRGTRTVKPLHRNGFTPIITRLIRVQNRAIM